MVYFDCPSRSGAHSTGLAPVAVTRSEQDAERRLEQLLTEAPGCDNMYEDYPYFPSDGEQIGADGHRDVVHLVIVEDDDEAGPVVNAVFGSLDAATTRAEELRQLGQPEASVVDMVMEVGVRSR